MKPLLQVGFVLSESSIRSITIESVTSPPESIIPLTFFPRGVPSLIAALSKSPVER